MATPSTAQLGSNQRQEDTERLIKCRRNLLQDNLYHLNQGCNHEDERQGLEILQSERIEYILLNTPGNDGCQGQDKSDGIPIPMAVSTFFDTPRNGQIPRNCDKTMLLTNIAEININKYSIISILFH